MTWLHVPSSALASALESEGSSLESSLPSPDTALCVMSSGKHSPRPLSWHGWKARPWVTRLSGTISRPSTAARGVASWISSLPGSHASPSPSPASSSGPPTSVGSGRTSSECLGRFAPDGSFSKTCLDLFGTDSDPSSVDWPGWGTMRNGAVSPRPELVPRTGGSGSSCSRDGWTTPTAWQQEEDPESFEARRQRNMAKGYIATRADQLDRVAERWPTPRVTTNGGIPSPDVTGKGSRLEDVAGIWPTPTSHERTHSPRQVDHGAQFANVVATWPTPRAEDSECSGARHSRGVEDTLTATSRSFPPVLQTSTCGPECLSSPPGSPPRFLHPKRMRLNPRFVEWLMNWPDQWTRVR